MMNYVFSYNAVLKAQKKLHISREKLRYLAAHDSLTSLYNRREFENLLKTKIANSSRNGSSFALFVIDIDNFKNINDTLGHVYGDKYIMAFAERLEILTRKGDIISRIGGDEFTLITDQVKKAGDTIILADRLVNGLGRPIQLDEKEVVTTVSIGIAIYPQDGTLHEDILKKADIAMYSSKYSGKNAYRFYEPDLNLESVIKSKKQ